MTFVASPPPARGIGRAELSVEADALSLLAQLGRTGFSSAASFARPRSSRPTPSARGSIARLWRWLQDRELVVWNALAWSDARRIRIVRITPTGKAHLRRTNQAAVKSEIEILQDRLGHAHKPHFGQTIFFAYLARRLGYATRLCCLLPTRNAIADVRLERADATLWVSLESGLARAEHPLDRWHRMAQAQAFLPLVASDPVRAEQALAYARTRVYVIKATDLDTLAARVQRGATTLWTQRYNRFDRGVPARTRDRRTLSDAAQGHGRLRQLRRCAASARG